MAAMEPDLLREAPGCPGHSARNLNCLRTVLIGLEDSLGLGDQVTAPSWQAQWPSAYGNGVISDWCQGNAWPFGVC